MVTVSVTDVEGPPREALREPAKELTEKDSHDGPEPVCPARAGRGTAQRGRRRADAPAAAHDAAGADRRRGDRAHRRRPARAHRDPHDPAQRHPGEAGRDRRRGSDGEDPQAAHRVVLSLAAGPAPADRRGAARGGDAGEVAAWRGRPLDEQSFPYVFCDATYCKARVGGRVVSRAVVIATGVSTDGRREVLGCDVGDSETEVFWTDFLRGLRDRGLAGVQLVISDSHRGLTNAIDTVLTGAAWQRCRVHFMRNVLARVSKGQAEMVAAAIRTIFAQPTADTVRDAVENVAATLDRQFPAVAMLLRDARTDITAFADFPQAHWRKIWSTNPLERLNKEVKRRTDVVGIFPDDQSLLRLASCVLIEAHDEWQVSDRRYLSEASMALLTPPEPTAIDTRRTDPSEVIDQAALQTA